MRAFVVTGPGAAEVREVPDPTPPVGEVVVDVERVGLCGTDVEFFTGHMAYLADGNAWYPMRLGHEWCGVVTALGPGVDPGWLGRRVTGDTMLGCGRCRLCATGRQHVCAARQEIGIRQGRPGALAERLAVPVQALHVLPAGLSEAAGALVEPGANAMRAALAAVGDHPPGGAVLVVGPGTIGLLTAMFLRSFGAAVHLAGRDGPGRDGASLAFARDLGLGEVSTWDELPSTPFDAVVDCTTGKDVPSRAVDVVQPGGRVVLIGLSADPSLLDSRAVVFKDLTVVGILSASPALARTVAAYAEGVVVPDVLVAGTLPLAEAGSALAGDPSGITSAAPKVHIDPRR